MSISWDRIGRCGPDGRINLVAESTELLEAAKNLIDRFGDKAVQEAEARARELENEGQTEAFQFWLKVLKLVRSLTEERPDKKDH